nr:cardiolipin synthase [Acholeplasmatales bacterium]
MTSSDRKADKTWKFVVKLIISILLLLVQLAFYFFLFFGINYLKSPHPDMYKYIYLVVQWIGIICVFLMYRKDINSQYKLSWTIFILLCPFLGTVAFILFGNGRVLPKRRQLKMEHYIGAYPLKETSVDTSTLDADFLLISKELSDESKYPLYKNNDVIFFKDALDKHNDMIKELSNAKRFIMMEYFIFGKGKIMEELIEIFERKGRQGIEIYIMFDDVGSLLSKDKKNIERLNNIPNLHLHIYEPIGLSINPRVNYRDHRKMCIIDGNICYTGGDNIADEYIHLKTRFGYWRDNAIKLSGNSVESFTNMFITMWYMSSHEKLDIEKYLPAIHIENDVYALPFGDGPMNRDNPGYHLFLNMINSAKKHLYISSPYFIIDNEMIDAIINKHKQGIDVKVLIPSIPDKKGVYMMTRAHIGSLLAKGVNVYTYTPGFNHAKNIIVDDKYAFIGTINMDYRSLLLHFENGVLLYNSNEIIKMSNDFIEAVDVSEKLLYDDFKKRNIFL